MKQINDRFTFDALFRRLLKANFNTTEVLNYILNEYSLSALVFQERIENKFYQKIKPDEEISTDLSDLKDVFFKEQFLKED